LPEQKYLVNVIFFFFQNIFFTRNRNRLSLVVLGALARLAWVSVEIGSVKNVTRISFQLTISLTRPTIPLSNITLMP